jgi:hypothetical protein
MNGKNPILKSLQENFSLVLICLLAILFAISLFKNISYPLLWADESITVMHGKRVLEYGYPKVHDGKNVLYDLRHPNPTLGIDEKTDAFIGGANWAMYYIAAVAVKAADLSDDMFTRTALLRIPFALAGIAGLALLGLLSAQFFAGSVAKKRFWALFLFIELISVPLALHLREVRYYPLTVFCVSLVIFIYARHKILETAGYTSYAVSMTVALLLMFLTFSPVYFILLAALSFFGATLLAQRVLANYRTGQSGTAAPRCQVLKQSVGVFLKDMLPVALSLISALPLISFFKTFSIGDEMATFNLSSQSITAWDMYWSNLSAMWRHFSSYDVMYLAIFAKVGLVFAFLKPRGRDSLSDTAKLTFSFFLTVIFAGCFFGIAAIPNFAFTRYFIFLQPVLAVIVIVDLALVYNVLSRSPLPGPVYWKTALVIACAGLIAANVANNREHLRGHIYELSHPYQGPLDYLIPFIQKNYPDTGNLVIATNYEETSFMYYLGAKVTVGFVGNNLDQDALIQPDIIIFRKVWGNHAEVFDKFLKKRPYVRIAFPVFDYPVNNIPELNFSPSFEHQFRTLNVEDEKRKVDMYVLQPHKT